VTPSALQAPAKINLLLAVTGRRPDGFHDIVSVAAPLAWGDTLCVEVGGSSFSVASDDPSVPTDGTNLVMRAAAAFAEASGWRGGARFSITKRIPPGSGLGGASSDAVCALLALNDAAGRPLDDGALALVASRVGSDCPLFLAGAPVVMRGRGERVERLPADAYRRMRGVRVLLFKPAFPIPTPWAYAMLAAGAPAAYVPAAEADARLAAWIARPRAPLRELLFNSMERPAFAKFPALSLMLETLRGRLGIEARMSGSGSACYALLEERADARPLEAAVREAWGRSAFILETRIA
jgi:4-diphosphocytidyl-2-C-methyl-D-erythritol kinase